MTLEIYTRQTCNQTTRYIFPPAKEAHVASRPSRRLLLVRGRDLLLRLVLLRVGVGRGLRVRRAAEVGRVLAVVLAAEGARVRGGRAHARVGRGPASRAGVAEERVVGPRLPHAAQALQLRRLRVPVRAPLAPRHHRAVAVHAPAALCLPRSLVIREEELETQRSKPSREIS